MQCLYGIPVYPGAMDQLVELSKSIKIVLMIDSQDHIDMLQDFARNNPSAPQQWHVYIKVDTGYHRAGVMTTSPSLRKLIDQAGASSAILIDGFYCHAGHSYKAQNAEEAAAVLQSEVEGVVAAASNLPADLPIMVSFGSTPAAHVVQSLVAKNPSNVKLELHAGVHTHYTGYIYELIKRIKKNKKATSLPTISNKSRQAL